MKEIFKEIIKKSVKGTVPVKTIGSIVAVSKTVKELVDSKTLPKETISNDKNQVTSGGSASNSIYKEKHSIRNTPKRSLTILKHSINMFADHRGCLDVREAACMAAHVYGNYKSALLIGGWMLDSSFDNHMVLKKGDLQTKLYSRLGNNGLKEYAYVFAGTRGANPGDWKNNFSQVLGLSRHYKQALKNAKYLSEILENSKLFFVGHSKGGGEATLCALDTGRPAVVFNPAPLSNLTKIFNRVKKLDVVCIDVYVCAKDPLYLLNNSIKNEEITPVIEGIFPPLEVLNKLDMDIIGDINVLDIQKENASILENHYMTTILEYYNIEYKPHCLPEKSNNNRSHSKKLKSFNCTTNNYHKQ